MLIYLFPGTTIMRIPLKQAHWIPSMTRDKTCLVASAIRMAIKQRDEQILDRGANCLLMRTWHAIRTDHPGASHKGE